MEGVLRYAAMLLEASHVPVTLVTLYLLMQGHVRVGGLIILITISDLELFSKLKTSELRTRAKIFSIHPLLH